MDIQFSARHFNASDGLQDRIQEEMDQLAKFYPNEENMGKAVDVALERVKIQLKKANDKQNDHRAQPLSDLA